MLVSHSDGSFVSSVGQQFQDEPNFDKLDADSCHIYLMDFSTGVCPFGSEFWVMF